MIRHLYHSRRGGSVVELLVVFSIGSIVVSILLVSVASSRASARRVECTNNLRQVCLALSQFESAFGHLPSMGHFVENDRRRKFSIPKHTRLSGIWKILPYLDHTELSEAAKRYPLVHSVDTIPFSAIGPRRETSVSTLLCPADSADGGNNIRFCAGSQPFAREIASSNLRSEDEGAFGGSGLRLSQVRGGLSHTAAISERIIGSGYASGTMITHGDVWAANIRGGTIKSELDATLLHEIGVELAASPPRQFIGVAGRNWAYAGKAFTLYDHIARPNENIVAIVQGTHSNPFGSYLGMVSATSLHPGGVNIGRLDGAIEFVSEEVDLTVFRRLGSIGK
ncbi:DUF1559 family PulG-like putative transporter [Crateriforma conspicua]|uniref:DUF1559 family PulG-like putative transporter n=1 Tax=Crateriforma conspicua TaxID=2527996 RepID=UPI00118BF095|nr:hypothetical protein Mal65_29780 [Crateriforma conspicua]